MSSENALAMPRTNQVGRLTHSLFKQVARQLLEPSRLRGLHSVAVKAVAVIRSIIVCAKGQLPACFSSQSHLSHGDL